MDRFLKLQEYDRESRKHFDLFVDVDRIIAVSPDMNMIYTAIGTFTISKDSMHNLMDFMMDGIHLDLTEGKEFIGRKAEK